ncbi:hypothetical protein GQ54DRAFT_297325 [Martensiomyces pterosporus]|nr:hypothetical protein GQ54DRAFT_297325 [Martensiomyces pterosporus]
MRLLLFGNPGTLASLPQVDAVYLLLSKRPRKCPYAFVLHLLSSASAAHVDKGDNPANFLPFLFQASSPAI